MPYQLKRYNGQPLVTVDDGSTEDKTTSITFVGKNFAGYGGIQNENFLYLLENFAGSNQPANAISGQIWYDSTSKKLKYFDSTVSPNGKWRTTGGAETGGTAPTNLTTGDFWFDTTSKQLQVWNGSGFTLIGPQAVAGSNQTNLESIAVRDTDGNSHAIVKAYSDGAVIFVISKDSFTLDSVANPITGFTTIHQGITLINSATGSTTTAYRFQGTATDTDKLGGVIASDYVLKNSAVFPQLTSFSDAGLTVGNSNDIKIFIDSGLGTIENTQSSVLTFKVKKTGGYDEPLRLSGTNVIPGVTDTYDLGTTSYRWNNVRAKAVYADTITASNFVGTITGIAAEADALLFDGDYRSASSTNVGHTIVARDASGNFSANIINATATQARYADLAEKYIADDEYTPGTVVVFGGDKEITVTDVYEDTRAAGVVSTDPAYLMNAESDGIAVALRGKVPCKVVGKIKKGDVIVTSTVPGHGKAGNVLSPASTIIGKALEDKNDNEPGVITVVVS